MYPGLSQIAVQIGKLGRSPAIATSKEVQCHGGIVTGSKYNDQYRVSYSGAQREEEHQYHAVLVVVRKQR